MSDTVNNSSYLSNLFRTFAILFLWYFCCHSNVLITRVELHLKGEVHSDNKLVLIAAEKWEK